MLNDIEKDFVLPSTLGAMAKTFYVKAAKNLKQDNWFLKQGSTVTGVKVIAQGEKIRDVHYLIDKYPLPNGELTKVEDWYKVRGTAVVSNGFEEQIKEIHWYQCENIGKVEFKVKEWSDKVES